MTDYKPKGLKAKSRNSPNSVFVTVSNDAKEGFWEIDLVQKKALFRKKNQKLLPSDYLEDYTEIYENVSDLIKTELSVDIGEGTIYMKEMIKNRKVIFSTVPFCCAVIRPNRTTEIQCPNEAIVYSEGKPFCRDHTMRFASLPI